MPTFIYTLLLCFGAFSAEEVISKRFVELPKIKYNTEYTFDSNTIHKLNLYSGRYKKLSFKNARVINVNTDGTRLLSFNAVNTDFYFAKFVGMKFKKCSLKNVHFYNSDLSFSDFRACSLDNVTFSKSVLYGTKK